MFVSLIRTYTPIVVGALVAWLASLGLDVGADATVGLVVFATAALQGIYYTVARRLEKRWPIAGTLLLGSSKQPVYSKPSAGQLS